MSEDATSAEPVDTGETTAPETTTDPANPEETTQEEAKEPTFEEKMDAELKKNPRTLKINGKERQVRSWAEWERYAAREMSAEERFTEAKKLRDEAEEFKKVIESGDILELLRKRGLDQDGMKKALGEVVEKLIAEEELDPRDRKLRDYEAKEAARKAAEEEAEKQRAEEARTKEIQTKAKKYVDDITSSAERLGLKGEPFLLTQVANELAAAYDEGVELSVDDAVRVVRDRFVDDYSTYIREMPFEVIKEVLGEDTIKRIQREAVAQIKTGTPSSKPAGTRKDPAQASDDSDHTDDFSPTRTRSSGNGQSAKDFFRKIQLGQI